MLGSVPPGPLELLLEFEVELDTPFVPAYLPRRTWGPCRMAPDMFTTISGANVGALGEGAGGLVYIVLVEEWEDGNRTSRNDVTVRR